MLKTYTVKVEIPDTVLGALEADSIMNRIFKNMSLNRLKTISHLTYDSKKKADEEKFKTGYNDGYNEAKVDLARQNVSVFDGVGASINDLYALGYELGYKTRLLRG